MEGVGLMKDLEFYRGKRVFVTGHTGFKGAWLCRILVGAGAEVTGYALPAPTQPNLFELAGLEGKMASVLGDIRDFDALFAAFQEARPEIVLHLAAQPIVRDSYKDPAGTYETNVMGTVNILECVRWTPGVVSFLNVTTDKVYHNNEWVWGYREDEPLDGFDPYSNSKSCSELVTHSYLSSFFQDSETAISTARAGNVIGGGDFSADRIIPDCVRAVQAGVPIQIRNPASVRPYQHVLEPLSAYLLIAQRQWENQSLSGSYNVGPDSSGCVTAQELADMFCRSWGAPARWEAIGEKGPHEDAILKLDCSKIQAALGWYPRWSVEQAIAETVSWTKAWLNGQEANRHLEQQIKIFLAQQP